MSPQSPGQSEGRLERLLSLWDIKWQPTAIESLGSAGGFSGARFWRLTTPRGLDCCLRQWPGSYPDDRRLAWIHAVLRHVASRGFERLPVPVNNLSGKSFTRWDGLLWELAPWLPGKADYRRLPRPAKLSAALEVLAEFHLAAASFPTNMPAIGPSPGVAWRKERLSRLIAGGQERLRASLGRSPCGEFKQRAAVILNRFSTVAAPLAEKIENLDEVAVPLQPCIRDVWHEHILFRENQVTGLIDFGAMRVDNVACDVARLLGSLALDDAAGWQQGLAAYEAIRPLSKPERRLVVAFDQTAVAMGGLQWIEWCCVEGRQFENTHGVLSRLDEFIERLDHWAAPRRSGVPWES